MGCKDKNLPIPPGGARWGVDVADAEFPTKRGPSPSVNKDPVGSGKWKQFFSSQSEIKNGMVDLSNDKKNDPDKNVETTNPAKEKAKVKLPQVEVEQSDLPSAAGIGKRIVVIENASYGPPLNQRSDEIDFTTNGKDVLDPFRVTGGRYWTADDTGKQLMFLAGNEKLHRKIGSPYKIIDYDFLDRGRLTLDDLSENEGIVENRGEQDLDTITTKLQGSMAPVSSSIFSTQQWILVKANSFLMPKNPFFSPAPLKQPIRTTSITPTFGSMNKVDPSRMVFNKPVWNAYWRGGHPIALDPLNVDYEPQVRETEVVTPEDDTPMFQPVIPTEESFFDHSFELAVPFSHKELKDYSGMIKPISAKFSPEYNFLIKKYEDVLGEEKVSEALLPNLYVMASEFVEEANNPVFQDHISLAGRLLLKDAPWRRVSRNREADTERINGQYFDKLARKYEEIYSAPPPALRVSQDSLGRGVDRKFSSRELTQRLFSRKRETVESVTKKFKNVAFPMDNIRLLKEHDDKKFLFPMYMDIEFSTDKTTTIAQVIKDSLLSAALQSRIMRNVDDDSGDKEKFVEALEISTAKKTSLGASKVEKITSFERNERRTWDITKWLAEFDKMDDDDIDDVDPQKRREILSMLDISDIGVFLGSQTNDERAKSDPHFKFYRQLLKIIFIGKLRKLIKKKFRTFEEMMTGKLAYSETVLYRVEKSKATPENEPGEVIQNFYFPNSNEIDVLKFVDTQVKYNKKYVYRIYAYQAVIGTKYDYSNITVVEDMASFMVTQYPSIKLVEIPCFTFVGSVIDNPPVFPEVETIPYRGINNKVLFFLRANTGDYRMDPVIIEPGDEESFNLIREARGLDIDDPIRFKSDDHSGIFQIFRTEEHPNNYQDFTGKLVAAVETRISKVKLDVANSAAFVDNIKPNTKYYYMFRVVDVHGHISNPSPVFEIEMVDERGTVYPLVEVVNFEEEVPRMPSRTMKKYIQIAPSLPHVLLDEERSKLGDVESAKDIKNVFLGVEDVQIWGKRFKVRFTSKLTGKKIDFNLDFTNKDVRISKVEEE